MTKEREIELVSLAIQMGMLIHVRRDFFNNMSYADIRKWMIKEIKRMGFETKGCITYSELMKIMRDSLEGKEEVEL